MNRETKVPVLIAKVAGVVCAFPIEHVVETMRPGAISDGMLVHRGERVRVVDAAALRGDVGAPRRCVIVRVGGGRASVLVDEVIGVDRVEGERVVKPMFPTERVDSELRAVLGAVRIVEAARG